MRRGARAAAVMRARRLPRPPPCAPRRAPSPRAAPRPRPTPRSHRRSAAPQLAAALRRHAATLASDFPLLHVRGDDGYELAPGVVEYLLDLFRELDAAGCFAQVPR